MKAQEVHPPARGRWLKQGPCGDRFLAIIPGTLGQAVPGPAVPSTISALSEGS